MLLPPAEEKTRTRPESGYRGSRYVLLRLAAHVTTQECESFPRNNLAKNTKRKVLLKG
jgi:hypothetical protein